MNKLKWFIWAQWNLKFILTFVVMLYSLVQIYCFTGTSYLHAGSLAHLRTVQNLMLVTWQITLNIDFKFILSIKHI